MENFKILIADDEYWTREKLRTMIDWESYGLTLLEPAQDGEEVLARIEKERPEILITDINMPFLSGVDLLREIQKKYPDIITFVISGYDDFEYVKESFLAGSINYLVKPVSRIDLVNALVKALDIMAQRNNEKQEFLKASSLIQDREFSQLLEQKEMPLTPDITMNSKVDFTGAKLMLVKIHDMADLAVHFQYDMNLLSFQLKRMIKELQQQENMVIFNYIYRSNEFILISEEESRELVAMAKKLNMELRRITSSPVSVVINEQTCSMDNIYQAYVQTVALLMTRTYIPESMVLCSRQKETEAETEQVRSRISEAQMKELHTLWKTGNKKAIREMIFENIGIRECSKQNWQYLEVKQTMRRIVNTWEEYIIGNQEKQKSVDYEGMVEAADKGVEKLDAAYLCEILDEMIELAEKYHVENSYFSRIFRREMGENLIHYLSRTRIEKAQEHMRRGNTNLTEIAFMVGYDDYTYFNKVFRKITGVSLREYRQSMENNKTVRLE